MKQSSASNENAKGDKAFSSISLKSFITVMILLISILIISGALSYFIPSGSFEISESEVIIADSYVKGEVDGIAPWRVLTAPVRVFFSEDGITIIMICLFLLIMSGIFNLLEKTNGIKIFIGKLVRGIAKKDKILICLAVLVFMLFGSFFGMFEELITLLPLMIILTISLDMDTMMGLGICMLSACFGFAAAITNPFSVGLAASVAGIGVTDGVWLRIIYFALIYVTLCAFLLIYLHRIRKNPHLSPTYEEDLRKKESLDGVLKSETVGEDRTFKIYLVFFLTEIVILGLIATVPAISGYAIPILAASFLVGGISAGLLVTKNAKNTFKHFLCGASAMLPAVLMIAVASSVKLVMVESEIIDTVMHFVIENLKDKNKFVAVILIYLLVLFLQFFIGSASAKIMLVMPIIMPIAAALGISPALVILVYCMADGFSDMIIPTNPILLVGLSIGNISYVKWLKWTLALQLIVFALTVLILLFAVTIGY